MSIAGDPDRILETPPAKRGTRTDDLITTMPVVVVTCAMRIDHFGPVEPSGSVDKQVEFPDNFQCLLEDGRGCGYSDGCPVRWADPSIHTPYSLSGFLEPTVSIDNWGFRFFYSYTTALLVTFSAATAAR